MPATAVDFTRYTVSITTVSRVFGSVSAFVMVQKFTVGPENVVPFENVRPQLYDTTVHVRN